MRANIFGDLRAVVAGITLALTPGHLSAEPAHGIAMYGDPALPPDFVSLPYANPDAPKGGKIVTRQLSTDILHGITRAAVLRFAREAQMEVEERTFTLEEAKSADEAFITSASTFVMPVVQIDDAPVGDGKPGPVAARLREIYLDESMKAAI